jgi:hypothetical protein
MTLRQLPLVLGQGPEDTDHHAACASRRINTIGDGYESDATVGQSLYGFKDVQGISPEPVEFPHHHGLAFAYVIHQRGQARAVITGSDMVSENTLVTPAAANASFCGSTAYATVETRV